MSFAAHVFVERLGLNPRQYEHVIYCPFHPDSSTKSLSVNLERGVFYCHGGCDEPRGGGPEEFVMKWARHKEGKSITPEEARKLVRRLFVVEDAASLSRQLQQEELLLFAHDRSNTYADVAKAIEREIARLGHPRSENAWAALATFYRELSWYDYAFETCQGALRRLNPELIAVFREAKARGEWGINALRIAKVRAKYRGREYALLRERDKLRETTNVCHPENLSQSTTLKGQPTARDSAPSARVKASSRPDPPSASSRGKAAAPNISPLSGPSPKRQPVLRRQPVPRRQPVSRPSKNL